jgi:hypothetical protein
MTEKPIQQLIEHLRRSRYLTMDDWARLEGAAGIIEDVAGAAWENGDHLLSETLMEICHQLYREIDARESPEIAALCR